MHAQSTARDDYARIEAAIRYLDANRLCQPSLDDLAGVLSLSPWHTRRLFRRFAGVPPKRFLECLTVEHAKRLLDDSASVLEASFAVGLSGPGRLHDHFVTVEAVSPGEYKRRGAGLELRHGEHPGPFGPMLLAWSPRGICALAFVASAAERDAEIARIRERWHAAALVHDPDGARALGERVLGRPGPAGAPLRVLVQGTNFQIKVWQALLRIPPGRLASYGDLARAVGAPRAARAVGSAVAANAVALLIPCHRVLRATGVAGTYRWGEARKRALIAWEGARAAS